MKLNPDLIRTRCQEIEESLTRLAGIRAEASKERFLADSDLRDIASYRLLVAIEAALSICYHLAAKELRQVPEEYAECFAILARAGIIDNELSRRLQQTARFRNMLVHMYWKVDYGVVYDIIAESLDDLANFADTIGRYATDNPPRTE
mgnify:CR=1 FL=1